MNINSDELQAAIGYFDARVIDKATDAQRTRALIYLDRKADLKTAAEACGTSVIALENSLLSFIYLYRARLKGKEASLPLFAA